MHLDQRLRERKCLQSMRVRCLCPSRPSCRRSPPLSWRAWRLMEESVSPVRLWLDARLLLLTWIRPSRERSCCAQGAPRRDYVGSHGSHVATFRKGLRKDVAVDKSARHHCKGLILGGKYIPVALGHARQLH